jgi:diacylglycerol O-acyltransferase / trehalose O-mycolyltransferase / mycolyltransferase Ag85
MPGVLKRFGTAAAVAAIAALAAGAPQAAANPSSCAADAPPKPSPRIVHTSLEGLDYNVLLPAGYTDSPTRRYPVLYLLHALQYNENTWLNLSDIEEFTAGFKGADAAIVVMPDGGPGGWYTNWPDGTEQWETYHLRHLIPAVDKRFRTIPGRGHRAVAGFSMGGYGALDYAARRPDLFVAAGGFSALAHNTVPEEPYAGNPASNPRTGAGSPGPRFRGRPAPPYRTPDDAKSGCDNNGNQWGDRNDDAGAWHGHNPADLAGNLRGATVYVANGNGTPCSPEDLIDRPTFLEPGDAATLAMSREFAQAARAQGVDVTTDFYGCGVHTMRYGERDLHEFWPLMTKAFGSTRPARFSHRMVDPDFFVWGWKFRADPKRADEFLEIRKASRAGFTLTGSGTENVVTARYFTPGQRVAVTGALPALARAGKHGRLRLRVDLGPAHTDPQFTAAGDSHPSFVTRVVTLRPVSGR